MNLVLFIVKYYYRATRKTKQKFITFLFIGIVCNLDTFAFASGPTLACVLGLYLHFYTKIN